MEGFARLLRSAAALSLLTCVSCYSLQLAKLPIEEIDDPATAEVMGVTLSENGLEIEFDPPGGRILTSAVSGRVDGMAVRFDLSDVALIWVMREEIDPWRTALLVVGVTALIGVAVVSAAVATQGVGFRPL